MSNRIVITERDLTVSTLEQNSVTDVVFIPGFATQNTAGTDEAVYCATVEQFESYFGTNAPVLGNYTAPVAPETEGTWEDILYPIKTESTTYGFDSSAVPYDSDSETAGVWFVAKSLDPSYVIAKELLSLGMPVYYKAIDYTKGTSTNPYGDADIAAFYEALPAAYDELLDVGYFNVKYITSGGYPTFEYTAAAGNISAKMLNVATTRGDAIAFIDHADYPARSLDPSAPKSVFYSVNHSAFAISDASGFGAMITPWGEFSMPMNGIKQHCPGSYAYLVSLCSSIRNNPSWLAIAGTTRGLVPKFGKPLTLNRLSNKIADAYNPVETADISANPVAINGITDIRPYGQCIWGNRTLKDNAATNNNTTALSFLNLRNLVCDVKKQLYYAAKSLMFEQNTDILWASFKAKVMPLLDQMVSGVGISGYKIIKETTPVKGRLKATVRLYPLYAVESFEICVELSNEEVNITEQ